MGTGSKEILIYPSLLSCDFGRLREEALNVEKAGADGIHVDVMDGIFVPNLTLGPPILQSLKGHIKIPLDCHLMVTKPEVLIEDFAKAGATSITVHLEACGPKLKETLQKVASLGCKAGVSIKPETPFSLLEDVLNDCDLILSMTVNPGFGGQKLIPEALHKTAELIKWLPTKTSRSIAIQIDGGVNAQNAPEARRIGVNILVAGNAVFKSNSYNEAIRALRGAH